MRNDLWTVRPSLLIAGLILAVAVGGCARPVPPPVPAMAALSANGDYGYAETALAPGLYAVTFVSPSLSAHGDPEQGYGLDGEKQRVAALALWRAAQLALEQGYPAFQVESETSDVNVQVEDPPAPPPYVSAPLRTTMSGTPCRWDCDRPIGYWGDPYFSPVYDNWYRRGHSSGRVTAKLTVRMLRSATAGAEDAAQTAERLRSAYGSATFDVR
ncbi:MAG TPA: hypothetical protein VE914_12420 [Candidatus Angelobacter sp.]|nr:hypothetical protein [Candidatus Angelobacter sp.]